MQEKRTVVNMILAGDIGGTKTLLGLYDPRLARPVPIVTREFSTRAYTDLVPMIEAFTTEPKVKGALVESACFGVAGPVLGETATLTNVAFGIDAPAVARRFEIPSVTLVNDLEAMAYAVPLLEPSELHEIQFGHASARGNIALIAAGTGLGEALLHRVDGRLVPSATEAGHADWAARTDRDITVLRSLIERFGRAEIEQVLSGPGLVNVHRLTHQGDCTAVGNADDPEAPARISTAALDRRCSGCVEALSIFVDAYGAEAGNLALRSVATGGIFVGGGIAPKILPALLDGRFVRAFQDKAPYRDMLADIPVNVILNQDAGLIGAAYVAAISR
jgi:glucokinase